MKLTLLPIGHAATQKHNKCIFTNERETNKLNVPYKYVKHAEYYHLKLASLRLCRMQYTQPFK